jgi:hypothetical protein
MNTLTGNEIEYKGFAIFNYSLNGSQTFAVELASSTIHFTDIEEATDYVDKILERRGKQCKNTSPLL